MSMTISFLVEERAQIITDRVKRGYICYTVSVPALVAQWIERLRPKESVGGSIPSQGTIYNLLILANFISFGIIVWTLVYQGVSLVLHIMKRLVCLVFGLVGGFIWSGSYIEQHRRTVDDKPVITRIVLGAGLGLSFGFGWSRLGVATVTGFVLAPRIMDITEDLQATPQEELKEGAIGALRGLTLAAISIFLGPFRRRPA